LCSSDRFVAGRLAEHHLGATVHLLDDGFQHLQLDRDIDLVIVAAEDLAEDARTLPSGRLREPPDTLLAADAIFAMDERVLTLGPRARNAPFEIFKTTWHVDIAAAGLPQGGRFLALAGIARPQRFFDDLRAAGCELVRELAFRDHYPYSRRDLKEICRLATAAGASGIVTTEKDVVRLLPFRPFPVPVYSVPLTMEPDPLPEFQGWLRGALDAARDLYNRVD
jgi:tetraacyldisaccharide 4'-kinase